MRTLPKIFLLMLVLLLTVGGGILWWANQPLQLRSSPLDFRVTAGSSLRSAITQMRESGINVDPSLLAMRARLNRADTSIKAGSYAVKTGVTPMQLLNKLLSGKVTQGDLTLVEGWTFRQWRARMDKHPDLTHETSGLSEAQIIAQLGLNIKSLEGQLFPDTYLFDKQSSDLELLARANRAMLRKLDAEWTQRAAGLPYKSPDGALVMASIVEKETGREADRASATCRPTPRTIPTLGPACRRRRSPCLDRHPCVRRSILPKARRYILSPVAMAAVSFRKRWKNTTTQLTDIREVGSER